MDTTEILDPMYYYLYREIKFIFQALNILAEIKIQSFNSAIILKALILDSSS